MKFYYKTKDGYTGMVKDVDALPSNIKKLIIRRYNGGYIIVPYVDELVLDCNRRSIKSIIFNTYNLSIYRQNIDWFCINNLWYSHDNQPNSTFNTLVRLKLEHVRDTSSMLANTLCNSIIPELDFTGIIWCADMFKNTNIDNIPHNINILTTMKYVDFYKGSKIPNHKLLASDKLLAISKKV